MQLKSECSEPEKDDYNSANGDCYHTHTRGAAKLEMRNQVPGIESDEREENDAAIADLRAEAGVIGARQTAFDANQSPINPPEPEQLTSLADNLAAVEALTVDRRIVNDVVSLATDSMNTFNEIQPG